MAKDSFKVKKSLNIEPKGTPTLDSEGDVGFNATSHKLEVRDNAATRSVVTEDGSATLTNKTIDGASNTLTNIPGSAIDLASSTAVSVATTNTNSSINIGTGTGTNTINIGGANSTVNITGTVNNQNVTNLNVADKLITINDGGAAGSGAVAGIEIEEGGAATGYVATSADRNKWEFKAPNKDGVARLVLPAAGTTDIVMTDQTQTLTNKSLTSPTLTGSIATDLDVGMAVATTTGGVLITSDATKTELDRLSGLGSTAVGVSDTRTLTNKSLSDSTTAIVDVTDPSKQIKFDAGGTASTSTTIAAAQTANRVLTLPDTTDTLVGRATTDTLSNKTFSDPLTLDGQASSPTAPSSGFYKMFMSDTTQKLTIMDSAGVETTVGSGAGGINYIGANDGTTASGWVTYADAAGSSPVDGTGGSANVTFATSSNSDLRGTTNFLFTHDANNRQGQGFSYDFTIDKADQAKMLQIRFDYLVASGTYADGDLTVWVYDVTNPTLIQPAPHKILNAVGAQPFLAEFQTASNSTSYRLIFHVTTNTATAYTMRFDNFSVGPQANRAYGTPVTDWVSFTPTGSWTTNTTYEGKYKRVGDNAAFRITISLSGAPTATNLKINMPSGLTIDSNKLPSASGEFILGTIRMLRSGVDRYLGTIHFDTSTSLAVLWQYADATAVTTTAPVRNNLFVNNTTPATWGSSDNFAIEFEVPIAGWSSNTVMSSDAATNVVAARATLNANQSIASGGSAKLVQLNSIGVDTTNSFTLGASARYVIPVAGVYRISAGVSYAGNATNLRITAIYVDGVEVRRQTLGNPLATQPTHAMIDGLVISLKPGQYIELYAYQDSGSPLNIEGNSNTFLSVERISGPAQIAASETVAALYKGAPPTGSLGASANKVTFGTKIKDSHATYNSGVYTIPTSGVYDISAQIGIATTITAGGYCGILIAIDGADSYENFHVAEASATIEIYPAINVKSVPLLAGQTVQINSYTNGTSLSFVNNHKKNWFSIIKVGNY